LVAADWFADEFMFIFARLALSEPLRPARLADVAMVQVSIW